MWGKTNWIWLSQNRPAEPKAGKSVLWQPLWKITSYQRSADVEFCSTPASTTAWVCSCRVAVDPALRWVKAEETTHLSSWLESALVCCCPSFSFFIKRPSSTFMFSNRFPLWLSVSSVGECLKWDGDRHSWDRVRRFHLAIFSVAYW